MNSGYWQDFELHLSQDCPTQWTMPSAVIAITSCTAVCRCRHTHAEYIGVLVGFSRNLRSIFVVMRRNGHYHCMAVQSCSIYNFDLSLSYCMYSPAADNNVTFNSEQFHTLHVVVHAHACRVYTPIHTRQLCQNILVYLHPYTWCKNKHDKKS